MSFSDARRCTAVAKRSRERCKNAAVTGFPTCRFHGAGSAKAGRPGGRPVVTGRYSTRLPERLAARYREALADTKLLELRDEVALVDTRLAELLGQLDTGESGRRWRSLQSAHADIKSAIASRDSALLSTALTALNSVIEGGLMEQALWEEILTLVDHRRKLVESERRHLIASQQMITAERAMILLANITSIIKEHVHDRTILAAISTGIRGLVSVDVGGESES